MGSSIRLQKFISDCGITSRRKAEDLIVQGKVRVNDKIIQELGYKVNPKEDKVYVNKKLIKPEHPGILILHKPVFYITSKHDPEGRRTVYDLIGKKYSSYSSIGRLDFNTSGLLVFSNDGLLVNRLMHPRYNWERVYRAKVKGSVSDTKLQRLSKKGINLEDGLVKAKAIILGSSGKDTLVELSLTEGRNRVVRRIMSKLGHPVLTLKRIAFGPFKLGKIKKGCCQVLSQKEYQEYRRNVFKGKI